MRTIAFLTIILASSLSHGQFKDKKSEVHAYKILKNADVSIQHRNGKIKVITWKKDSVRLESTIEVESNSLDKNHDVLSNARFNISAQPSSIYVSTDLGMSKVKKEWESLKNKTGIGNIVIQSDLVVYLPETCDLRIEQKYGDIDMENYSGPMNLVLRQGDLRAGNLSGLEKLDCQFADVRIEQVEKVDLMLLFSETSIKKAKKLRIDSKSSEIDLGTVEEITFVTTKDRLEVENLGSLTATGNLSKVYIDNLNTKLHAELKFGKLRVNHVHSGCTNMTFRITNTDVELNLEPNAAFQVTTTGEDLNVQYPKAAGRIELNNGSKTGYIGKANTSSMVTAFGSKSTIAFYINN